MVPAVAIAVRPTQKPPGLPCVTVPPEMSRVPTPPLPFAPLTPRSRSTLAFTDPPLTPSNPYPAPPTYRLRTDIVPL